MQVRNQVGRATGRRWLEGGAGDENRKYRWCAPAFRNHGVASARSAACDYCVKNAVIPANASQCDDWEKSERSILKDAEATLAYGDFSVG
jgi:hypothetical protein